MPLTFGDIQISSPKMAVFGPGWFTVMFGLVNNVFKNVYADVFRWDMCSPVPLQLSPPTPYSPHFTHIYISHQAIKGIWVCEHQLVMLTWEEK